MSSPRKVNDEKLTEVSKSEINLESGTSDMDRVITLDDVPKDSKKSKLSNSIRKRWLDDEVAVNIFNLKRTITKDDLFDFLEDVGKIQRISINNR